MVSHCAVMRRFLFLGLRNRYRLIAFIAFRSGIVYVKEILSHKEYDKGQWKQ